MSEFGLLEVAPGVIVRPMLTLDMAVDIACSNLAAKTKADYTRVLHRFADQFPPHTDVATVTEDDWFRYFATRQHLGQNTRAWEEKVLYSSFEKLRKVRKIKVNPFEYVPRTKSPDPESLDLVRISSSEVALMLTSTETEQEEVCLAILAYLGPRRKALALLRKHDYKDGKLRFQEKGGKTIWKPVPDELAVILDKRASKIGPDDYLIPAGGPLKKGKKDRDDRVIWRVVTRVAKRCGVKAHTHSLRAAFADFCLDNGMEGKALQLLMGHKNAATTERYIQRFDREKRMESVRGLSWSAVQPVNEQVSGLAQPCGSRLDDSLGVGAGGFEPPERDSGLPMRPEHLSQLLEALKQAIPTDWRTA